jgi:hypothetical protein
LFSRDLEASLHRWDQVELGMEREGTVVVATVQMEHLLEKQQM